MINGGDQVAILSNTLQTAGFPTIALRTTDLEPRPDLNEFFASLQFGVIVYDLSEPYTRRWHLFERLRALPSLARCAFVLTSPNEKRARQSGPAGLHVPGTLCHPEDVDAVLAAVRDRAGARVPAPVPDDDSHAHTERRVQRLPLPGCQSCEGGEGVQAVLRAVYVLHVRCRSCGEVRVLPKPGVRQPGEAGH